MRIIIPEDYQDAVRGLACFSKLAGHDVTVFNDTVKDVDGLAARMKPDAILVNTSRSELIAPGRWSRRSRLGGRASRRWMCMRRSPSLAQITRSWRSTTRSEPPTRLCRARQLRGIFRADIRCARGWRVIPSCPFLPFFCKTGGAM